MNQQNHGNISIFASVICLALATVFTHQILKNISPIVFAFYCFLFVTTITAIIKFIFFPKLNNFLKNRKSLKHIGLLNIYTAIDWVSYLAALKYIDPSFTNALVFGISPIASLSISRTFNKLRIIYSILILIILTLIACHYITYLKVNHIHLLIGIFFALISGIAVGGTTISIKILSDQNMSIVNVITTRYIFTLIASLNIASISKISLSISLIDFLKILSISILFVLLPSYLVQKGAKYISAFNSAAIGASTPAFTYLFFIVINHSYSIVQLIYIIILWIVIIRLTIQKNNYSAM